MTTPSRTTPAALLVLGCLLVPAAPAARAACPQEVPTSGQAAGPKTTPAVPDTRPQVVPEADLTLHYYTPRHADARELAQVLGQLAGRSFFVQAEDGSTSQPVSNVRTFGNVVVLYDRPERIAVMVQMLAELEQADALDTGEADAVVVVEYKPQYLPTRALYDVLRPLQRNLPERQVPPRGGSQPVAMISNVSGLEQPATLVLRDTPERVEQMLQLVRRVDVPPPQVQLTCWLLRGIEAGTAGTGTPLPADLVQNLSSIVPYAGFRRLCVSMIRTSILPGRLQKLRSEFQDDEFTENFELMLEPAGFDREAGMLPITLLRFEASTGQEFETSVTLRAGEYTVLGATGSQPLFVVLQFAPLDD